MKFRPVVLCVLDGWGARAATHGNVIAAARTPQWDAILARYPSTTLEASGEAVGLPKGIMGNSEVGHMNMGSGRVVPQGVVVIDEDIASGNFADNATLGACIEHVRATGGTLHFMGLLSDGQVHSSMVHLCALLRAAHAAQVRFAVDAFLDGRDTPPRSAQRYVTQLEAQLAASQASDGVASIMGRFYAMDRDGRWDRTQRAYDALAQGRAPFHAGHAADAVEAAYARGEDDEFVAPTIVGTPRPVRDGDACIFFNFRPDRARQLTLAFSDVSFDAFPVRRYRDFIFATMTKYEETFANPVLFGPRPQHETFGELISRHGLRQLRLAETEKYAHVTYFFNGGREDVFPGEDRKLIASNRSVATYDHAPAMRAREITQYAVEQIGAGTYDVIVMNYANADMVGHTGKWEPTIASIEVLDACLRQLGEAVIAAGGLLVLTADHGNAEDKIDADGAPLTAHTTNPVPLVFVAHGLAGELAPGKLGDIAPTLLEIMGLPRPGAMTGSNLFTPLTLVQG